MKKVSSFLGLIFLILSFSAQGQIVTKYQQGFEATGENHSYTVLQGSATPVTNVASSGNRSLKLSHGAQDVIVMLDTIDFSDNGSFQYFYSCSFQEIPKRNNTIKTLKKYYNQIRNVSM